MDKELHTFYSVSGVFLAIFIIIFVLKCCLGLDLDKQKGSKIGRRRRYRRAIYESPASSFGEIPSAPQISGNDVNDGVSLPPRTSNTEMEKQKGPTIQPHRRYPNSLYGTPTSFFGEIPNPLQIFRNNVDDGNHSDSDPLPRTSNTASPVVVPPYPVDARHPTPQTNSGIGFGGSNPPYPTHTPHPIPTAGITPYPPTSAPTPYPPTSPPVSGSAPYPDYSGSPPSYSEAVAHAPVQPPKLEQEAFGKQAPYNPNY